MGCREVIGFAAQFAAYEQLKGPFVSQEKPHLTLVQTAIVGPVSMAIGWLFSYPQDVIKTKLQVAPEGTYKKWRGLPDGGIIECGKAIYKANGFKGFFMGLSPCLIRAAYSEGIGIMAYEKTRELLWDYRAPYYNA
jgi:solute carrier family 25 (mitochondrial carnitine/acylcarnitine transporter), member 20/29